ncbi:unnamed protein product [Ectocarpus sp. CCAP 1310/34]|nr:unnamed protein product [Ectocarpus sp. CCAP 1310/34]
MFLQLRNRASKIGQGGALSCVIYRTPFSVVSLSPARSDDNKKDAFHRHPPLLRTPGRGEATGVALAYGGKDFVDNTMGFSEHGACKWAGKGLPVLEMDDAEYFQSTALLRYAGKMGGLYPDDALAALEVDEIVMIAEDVLTNMFKCMGQTDDTVAKGVLEGKIKTLVEMLVAKLATNQSSKFFVGNSPTIANLQVHAVIKNFEANFLTDLPTTLIADTAPTVMEMEVALLQDPKEKASTLPRLKYLTPATIAEDLLCPLAHLKEAVEDIRDTRGTAST